MTTRDPVRDRALAQVLRESEGALLPSDASLARLGARIAVAAAPMLEHRAAPERTVWDYAERWSSTLLPLGALTAIAAGLCLFVLSGTPSEQPRQPGVRLALLGAATNRMSSQNLVDFLVAGDAAQQPARRSVP